MALSSLVPKLLLISIFAFTAAPTLAQSALELMPEMAQSSVTLAEVANGYAVTHSGQTLQITSATVLLGFERPVRGLAVLDALQPGMDVLILEGEPRGARVLLVEKLQLIVK